MRIGRQFMANKWQINKIYAKNLVKSCKIAYFAKKGRKCLFVDYCPILESLVHICVVELNTLGGNEMEVE